MVGDACRRDRGRQDLDVVVKEHISGPLSMDDTMFILDDGRRDNCVIVHVPGEDGGWTSAGEILNQASEY